MKRTNIAIDPRLIREAMRITGARSQREAVDIALRRLVDKESLYKALAALRGRLPWKGDIGAGRRDRS
jgi:Arc/MetJ family transcription regulator